MYIGVGCFEKYSAWSIATTDGLSQGVPYLLPNGLCFPEMLNNYPLFYSGKQDFAFRLKRLLDTTKDYENTVAWIKKNMSEFLWKDRIARWFDGWKVLDNMDCVSRSEGYEKLVNLIKTKAEITKEELLKELGWGKDIKFSRYRNLLRKEENIIFRKASYVYSRDSKV